MRDLDPAATGPAASSGAYAALTGGDPDRWPCALDMAASRFRDYRDLKEVLARATRIERACGILMERHATSGEGASAMLRDHARRGNHRLIDVATAVLDGHGLLPGARPRG